MRWAVMVAGLALLSACGSQQSPTQSGDPSVNDETPFAVTATGEMEVSCDGAWDGWPAPVMPEGVPGVLSDGEARDIFEQILSDPATGEEAGLSLFRDGVDVEWRVLRSTGQDLTIGLGRWSDQGPVGDGAYALELERQGESWRPAGWAQCSLSPVLKEGLAWAEVTGYRGDAQATTVTAEVRERQCTSARDLSSFLHEPFVVETAESVTMYWTSDPAGGDCQATPTVERAVELSEPLGDRAVFDGSSYPPQRVPVP